MKKLLFLYNTHAGKGLLKSRLAAVQDALAAAGGDVTIHPTQGERFCSIVIYQAF